MTQVVNEPHHVNDDIVEATKMSKTKNKGVTVSTAVTPELLEHIDLGIQHLNTRFPEYLQCNRSNFVLGAIMLALKDLDAMVDMN